MENRRTFCRGGPKVEPPLKRDGEMIFYKMLLLSLEKVVSSSKAVFFASYYSFYHIRIIRVLDLSLRETSTRFEPLNIRHWNELTGLKDRSSCHLRGDAGFTNFLFGEGSASDGSIDSCTRCAKAVIIYRVISRMVIRNAAEPCGSFVSTLS